MLDKVFVYESQKHGLIFLNGPYNADPEILLKIYINWYHNEYGEDEETDNRIASDFVFKDSRCPIDFYEDYKTYSPQYKGVING